MQRLAQSLSSRHSVPIDCSTGLQLPSCSILIYSFMLSFELHWRLKLLNFFQRPSSLILRFKPNQTMPDNSIFKYDSFPCYKKPLKVNIKLSNNSTFYSNREQSTYMVTTFFPPHHYNPWDLKWILLLTPLLASSDFTENVLCICDSPTMLNKSGTAFDHMDQKSRLSSALRFAVPRVTWASFPFEIVERTRAVVKLPGRKV